MNISQSIETIQRLIESEENHNPHEVMENVLLILENIPLLSHECRLLDDLCLGYMKAHGISSQDGIFQLYLRRMSFTFIPGITKLNIHQKKVNSSFLSKTTTTIPATTITPGTTIIPGTTTPTNLITDSLIDLSEERISGNNNYSDHESLLLAVNYTPSGFLYKCTMQRRRTALQTSYRLYIDGCTSLSTTDGSLSRMDSSSNIDQFHSLQLSLKGLVLCAKKQNRNLGLSSSYQIWAPSGWKEWKEKMAIGKLTRNNGIYCGSLTEYGQETLVSSCPSQYLPYLPENKRCISVKVLSGGLDKLLHVAAAVQIDPCSLHQDHDAITPPCVTDSSPETTQDPETPTSPTNANVDPENDPELVLPSIVESICSSKASSSQLTIPLPSNTFLLQSRRPKKLKFTDQQLLSSSSSYYTIHYGENGRVKNPSRKNIVMERMKYDSTNHTVHNNIFHTSENSKNGLHLLEPEWMSNEPLSSSPRSTGNGYSPPVDFPILQVSSLLHSLSYMMNIVWEDE